MNAYQVPGEVILIEVLINPGLNSKPCVVSQILSL